jgi:hypothetical protein
VEEQLGKVGVCVCMCAFSDHSYSKVSEKEQELAAVSASADMRAHNEAQRRALELEERLGKVTVYF